MEQRSACCQGCLTPDCARARRQPPRLQLNSAGIGQWRAHTTPGSGPLHLYKGCIKTGHCSEQYVKLGSGEFINRHLTSAEKCEAVCGTETHMARDGFLEDPAMVMMGYTEPAMDTVAALHHTLAGMIWA